MAVRVLELMQSEINYFRMIRSSEKNMQQVMLILILIPTISLYFYYTRLYEIHFLIHLELKSDSIHLELQGL